MKQTIAWLTDRLKRSFKRLSAPFDMGHFSTGVRHRSVSEREIGSFSVVPARFLRALSQREERLKHQVRRRFKIMALFMAGGILGTALIIVPEWQATHLKNLTPKEHFDASNEARKTLEQ